MVNQWYIKYSMKRGIRNFNWKIMDSFDVVVLAIHSVVTLKLMITYFFGEPFWFSVSISQLIQTWLFFANCTAAPFINCYFLGSFMAYKIIRITIFIWFVSRYTQIKHSKIQSISKNVDFQAIAIEIEISYIFNVGSKISICGRWLYWNKGPRKKWTIPGVRIRAPNDIMK